MTATELSGILEAVAAARSHRVVLDLADVQSIDVEGSSAIVTGVASVTAQGPLTIRSASRPVRRQLALHNISPGVMYVGTHRTPRTLGPEERAGDRSAPVDRPISRSLDDLRAIHHYESSPAVLDAALRLVVAVAARTVRGADGASITLQRSGKFTTAVATDETILQMDRDQYAASAGPCLAAATDDHWFYVKALADETRWPGFVSRATGGGVRSILSTPLRGPWRPVGALNIYSNSVHAFGRTEQALAALLATQASGILADAGLGPYAVDLGRTADIDSPPPA